MAKSFVSAPIQVPSPSNDARRDISTTRSPNQYGQYPEEKDVVETFMKVMREFALLSPRNRYLLARSVWVAFDLDQQVPKRGRRG